MKKADICALLGIGRNCLDDFKYEFFKNEIMSPKKYKELYYIILEKYGEDLEEEKKSITLNDISAELKIDRKTVVNHATKVGAGKRSIIQKNKYIYTVEEAEKIKRNFLRIKEVDKIPKPEDLKIKQPIIRTGKKEILALKNKNDTYTIYERYEDRIPIFKGIAPVSEVEKYKEKLIIID